MTTLFRYLNQSSHQICGREGNACFKSAFDNYQEDLADLTECDCRSDCGGIHVFSSMSRYSFNDETATQPTLWWNPKKEKGRLAEYLLDKDHTLVDEFSKNMTRLALNLSSNLELADKRFRDDVTILNVFFDTPIITQVKLEMKVTVFDQISAIGGTLGLFTGVSLISFVEITYWLLRLVSAATFSAFFGAGGVSRGGMGSASNYINNSNNRPRASIFGKSSTVDIINRDNNSMSEGGKSVDLPPLYQNYANPEYPYRR